MKLKFLTLILLLFALASSTAMAGTISSPYEVGTWRGFRTAAVSYTFDDNCSNQYSIAVPMFNAKGFKITLFTVSNWAGDWSSVKTAAGYGHEIASHTVDHADFNSSSTDQTAECRDSQTAINNNVTGQKCVTIAYPYGSVGNESITSQYYIAARGLWGIEASTPSDFMSIASVICGDAGTNDLNGTAENAASSGGWCVYTIHGIDGDGYSPLSSSVLQSSIDYMDANRSKFWVDTFGNVVRYIRERNDVSISETSSSDNSITLSVTDSLDTSTYSYPISIRRPLPFGWSSAKVSQNGANLNATAVNVNGTKYVMFDAVPNGGSVTITNTYCNINMSSTQQAIDGYGFSSAWCGALTDAKNNALYNTLGMSLLRIQIDPNGYWSDETKNAAAAHAAGAKVLGTSWSAPGSWTTTGGAYDGHLLPSHYADYANWLKQAVSTHKLDWVSPANEPDLGWMAWTSDELKSWIGQYGGSLGAPLIAPESCWFADGYTNAVLDDSAAGPNISIVGGHRYFNGPPSVHQDPLSKGKHVWMTEYYIEGINDINACMNIAQDVSDHMNCQFSAYIWWWVPDGSKVELAENDGTINLNGYMLGQFAKWIKPGSTKVTAEYNPQPNVTVTAYKTSYGTVVVALNTGTTPVSQQFIIQYGNAATMEGYRSSASEKMADIGSFTVSKGSFAADLPAQSVTTFVQTSNTPMPTGTIMLIARHSGKAMDAYGASTGNGTQIIQWTYGGGANQHWIISPDNGYYKILGVQSGKAIEVTDGNTANDSKVQLWDYYGFNWQKFSFVPTDGGYYEIVPSHASSSCLDVAGISSDNGANVHLWERLGAYNQQWYVQSVDLAAPSITSLSPSSVSGEQTFTLTVNGANFQPGAVIKWNGTNMATTFVSQTQLTATINKYYTTLSSYPGTANVVVLNADGKRSSSTSLAITQPVSVPTITSLSPSTVSGVKTFTLTVNGTNFVSGSIIKWNGTNMTTTYVSATQLTASINKYYTTLSSYPGSATISVLNSDGTRSTGATLTITAPLPAISSLSPTSVTGATTFTLTVNGSNFVSGSIIKWNGTNITTTYVSATQLTASINKYYTTLSSYPGSATVSVLNPDGGRSSGATIAITQPITPPAVTSLSPSSVKGATTFTLTVNGTGFQSGAVIKWNGTNMTTTYVSATQLTTSINKYYTTLSSYPGSATVSVLNPDSGRSSGTTLYITAP